ncbi:large-conductance mechanosensitive channel [Candidatus Adlerbacteria bacterium RIFCSPHIGHO2_12_FULL_53_18]|uniref:Large-conductance mechanosensitive channel n=1 Tax=Candidatus Adlerbacteria bacterium RIFCSPHIGHO2_12_FULL_53_18 TaxID=1797242 RepID=A0A1F4XSE3_9BACT|nr:MAG: large-conductance mechanosensitive channel [Candidatus Adlerbacteria bacterium RIFCSPHIGHO2_12_FULL_53_18]
MLKKTRGVLEEFKGFAIKGNALELAIGVVVGGAFGKIISSLVADVITPTIALMTGSADFKHLSVTLREDAGGASDVVLTYGAFLQAIFDFFFIAVSIFLVFKIISSARKRLFVQEEQKPAPPYEKPAQERLLEEIRDLLKEKK